LLGLAVWLFLLNGWLIDAGPARRRTLVVLGTSVPAAFGLGWWLMPSIFKILGVP